VPQKSAAGFKRRIRLLETHRAELECLLEAVQSAAVLVDPALHIQRCTPGAERLSGLRRNAPGGSLSALTAALINARLLEAARRTAATGLSDQRAIRCCAWRASRWWPSSC
jgi:nitrogen fixation/metabolism regulation signal transduction histidine kinase